MNHGNPFFNTTIPFGTLNHEVLTIPSYSDMDKLGTTVPLLFLPLKVEEIPVHVAHE
jgi:hypothetical protein